MAMDGLIEPDSFDLIVVGTGLPESILAAAAANAGRTVLHLDHLDFYGAHWTSLTFSQLCKWAGSGGSFAGPVLTPSNSSKEQDFGGNDSTGLTGSVSESGIEGSSRADALVDQSLGKENVDLNAEDARIDEARSEKSENVVTQDQRALGLEAIEVDYDKQLYWEVEVNECADVDLGASRFYNMDLAGPRLTFCGSQLVNLLLRSGASNYIEFKGVEATYMWTKTGLSAVPASRSDVFMDKSLSLSDKRFLMRFFKLVTDHANAEGAEISLETLESPFVEFMRLQNLPTSMQSYRAAPIGGQ